jgi:hypothetical protein
MHGEARNIHRIFIGKPEGKRYLERPGIMRRVILQWIINECYTSNKNNIGIVVQIFSHRHASFVIKCD